MLITHFHHHLIIPLLASVYRINNNKNKWPFSNLFLVTTTCCCCLIFLMAVAAAPIGAAAAAAVSVGEEGDDGVGKLIKQNREKDQSVFEEFTQFQPNVVVAHGKLRCFSAFYSTGCVLKGNRATCGSCEGVACYKIGGLDEYGIEGFQFGCVERWSSWHRMGCETTETNVGTIGSACYCNEKDYCNSANTNNNHNAFHFLLLFLIMFKAAAQLL